MTSKLNLSVSPFSPIFLFALSTNLGAISAPMTEQPNFVAAINAVFPNPDPITRSDASFLRSSFLNASIG